MVGASMLWVGWFGFNAGSALEANGTAAMAMVNTFLATAAAVVDVTVEWIGKGKPSLLGHRLRRGGRPGGDHPGRGPVGPAGRWSSARSPAWSASGA
jgi:Amt family ammonium transporter